MALKMIDAMKNPLDYPKLRRKKASYPLMVILKRIILMPMEIVACRLWPRERIVLDACGMDLEMVKTYTLRIS